MYQTLVDLLVEVQDEKAAYEVVLRAKSSAFVSFYERVRSVPPSTSAITTQQRIAEEKSSERKFLKQNTDDADSDSVQWLSEWEELRMWALECEKRWKLSSSNAARDMTLGAVQKRLNGDTALLDMFFTKTKLYVFTITHKDFFCIGSAITQKEISDALEDQGFFDGISGSNLYAVAKNQNAFNQLAR